MQNKMKSIKVDVSRGMFSSEVVATVDTVEGRFDFFVAKDKLKQRGDDYFLEVYAGNENPATQTETVALPLYVEGAVKRVLNIQQCA
jgi:hypothetical protein